MTGTVYTNNGYWFWRGVPPGETKRRAIKLCAPGSDRAMPASRPKEDALAAAHRTLKKLRDALEAPPPPERPTDIDALCDGYERFANACYRNPDGSPATAAVRAAAALRRARDMFKGRCAGDLSHADTLRLRDSMAAAGFARTTVNSYMAVWRQMVAWALDEGIIPAQVAAELSVARPLKPHRSAARETEPVRPAPEADVEAALRTMPPNLSAMARVQRLTGMRPGEVCAMRWSRIDRDGPLGTWVYRPQRHKESFRGLPRAVAVGPRAQRLLLAARAEGEDLCFSPKRAVAERMRERRAARKTPVQPSQRDRRDPAAIRRPGDEWNPKAYARAVRRACEAAGARPWHPHQLRHSFGTEVRRRFGLAAARAALGHSAGAGVTDRYSFEAAEEEALRAAAPAVAELG